MNLKEVGWEGMGGIDLAQEGAFGGLLQAQYVLSGYINCKEFLDYLKSYYLVNKNSMMVVSAFMCGLASVHQSKNVEFISMWGYPQRGFFHHHGWDICANGNCTQQWIKKFNNCILTHLYLLLSSLYRLRNLLENRHHECVCTVVESSSVHLYFAGCV